ncbi:hypothetical protein [Pedobacter cryoconitis]|uniref:DUF4198 domain-containing protein n=1 Tax=Pedobacter cryoconitis TaxID=188932 RepID=A0A327T3E0_9SPHI|nr:hypothetical protein [Pedobacter cryoconitis]RAJ32257.1 hypothetical protein LY11_01940 [Pedobacter cryoconitis]
MKRIIYSLLFFLVCLPVISQAHGYWFVIKGPGKVNQPVQIQICFGEIDQYNIRHRETGPELIALGDFKVTVLDEKGKTTVVTINPKADCWEGTFTPREKGVYQILARNESLPVVDRSKTGGKSVRPIDYLCAAYTVEHTGYVEKPVQFLDIVTATRDKMIIVRAFNNGNPAVSGTKLRVFNPQNWEKSLEIDAHGEAAFMPVMKGLYIIRQDYNLAEAGSYKGLPYTSIRYRCNYSLLVD